MRHPQQGHDERVPAALLDDALARVDKDLDELAARGRDVNRRMLDLSCRPGLRPCELSP
jgi:hypothetical protein